MGRWFPIAKRGVAMNLKATTLTYLAIAPHCGRKRRKSHDEAISEILGKQIRSKYGIIKLLS